MEQENKAALPDQQPPAPSGNSSNPPPREEGLPPSGASQLLEEQAEKYLREAGNIEDLPDARDQQEADALIREKSEPPPPGK
ncbi:hypothetical protein V9K67_17190 [Paraflavisolibacter sp. H34]|uniref:hypothetical protein n=1 Tax=Huijunlia imazamoxiresistens TaxID=3127457 RepID=UPI00301606B1